MNKQEVIKELMSKSREIIFGDDENVYLSRKRTIELVSQIHEPQTVAVPKFRVWDTVKKAMSEVQAIVYTEERVYPFYSKVIRRYIPFSEAILMQSTGLFDINGKEIFEGDIVRMHSGELLPVKLHHGMFEPVCYYASRAFGRVGNVFENPELLEHPDFREDRND